MKTLISIILTIIIVFLASCTTSTTYPTAMQQAEECMNTRPDSALTLLGNISDSICQYPKEVQMYWHLLTIQAKDKQYIVHTSDSLINRIVEFYETNGDKSKLMLAYYYQGRVFRDMNDATRALKAFQKAEEQQVPDWDLLTKVYSQMGYLFAYQGLYDEAISVNRKSISIYNRSGKEYKTSYAWRDIARMYDMKRITDSALIYYQKACDIALTNKDTNRYYGILSELGGKFYEMGKHETAKRILLEMVQKPTFKNKSHIYSYLGNIYENNQQWDSAYYYRQKALETNNIHKKFDNYIGLGWIEKARGNEKQALHYLEKALWLNDSIQKITRTEEIAKINSLYNYQHTEAENNRLQLKQEQHEKMLLAAALIILTAAMLCVWLVISRQQERKKFKDNEEKLKQLHKLAEQQNQTILEANKEKIKELENTLQDNTQKKGELEKQMAHIQVELLKWQNQGIQLSINQKELAVKALTATDAYIRFRRVSLGEKIEIKASDWSELRSEINLTYPNFLTNLQELYPKMSLVETRICLLTKIGMPPAHIAKVLGYSRSSITTARDRLYKKIFGTDGTAEKFVDFILNA